MVKEPHEEAGREFQHLARFCGPDGRPHGDDVVIDEVLAVLLLRQIIA